MTSIPCRALRDAFQQLQVGADAVEDDEGCRGLAALDRHAKRLRTDVDMADFERMSVLQDEPFRCAEHRHYATTIVSAVAISAGLSCPSISTVFSVVTSVRPPPFASSARSLTRVRTLLARGHGRQEAHAIEPVVKRGADACRRDPDFELRRPDCRQCEVSVRDRAAERAFARRPLAVDMDPLAVASAVREFVDALLIHAHPLRDPELLAEEAIEGSETQRASGMARPSPRT